MQIKDYKTIAAFEDFTVKIYDGKLGYKDLLKLTGEMPKNIEHIEVVYNNTDFGDFYEYSKKQVAKMFGSEFEQGSPIVNFLKNGNEIEIQNAIGTLKNGEQVYYSKDKLEWCMGYEKGGELDDREETYKKWKSLVNMSKSELENFYNSGEGKKAGLSSSEAKNLGIHSGRESARWIMKMKDTPKSEWTPTMWKWAKRQISFISRMSGNKGGLYDDKGNKTRKHTSLLIWGHNPKKHKSGGTISQTPAPKKDKVYGSKVNVEGSSKDTKSAKEIKFDAKTLLSINNKVKEHNKQHPDKKVTLATAKAVVRRGMGAYSSTHRPTISGGKPNSRVAWGLARLNAFMYKIVHGKSKSGKYSQDDDLINELGYKVKSYANGGEVSDIKSFNDWFVNWYKNGVCKKMNIIISVPNKLTNLLKADEDNAMILDLFEKTDQSIDEKKYMDEMLDKADQYGVILYAKHNPSYQMFGFEPTPDNYMKRFPNGINIFSGGGRITPSRSKIPNVRGGWTKDKILKYLKEYSSDTTSTYTLEKFISEFDNWQQLKDHLYYHGTPNYIEKGLKPSITFSERFSENQGGGGYGERYWGISLTKRKRTAESFSGTRNSVTIYPVFLKRDAKVIERLDLQDSYEIEEIIVELYENNVDAVWIGGGEEELVVVNPQSILFYKKGGQSFNVYGGFKSIPLTDEEIKKIYDESKELWDKYSKEYSQKSTKEEKDDFLNSIKPIKFKDGGDVELLAPNRKPSNLTPEQWHLVRTPQFKKWFGDWENDPENASKVVDENGEPLVVYHGTGTDFNIFKVGKTRGIMFSDKKSSAKLFSEGDLKREGTHPHIKECFLNIKKPFYKGLTKDEILEKDYWQQYFNERPFISKKSQKSILSQKDRFSNEIVFFGILSKEGKEKIIQYNYDGVVFDSNNNAKTYVAFEPNQIKLADGTNTTFDSNNPDIRYAKGGLIAPNGKPSNLTPEQYKLVRTTAFKKWFGDWENDPENASKVVDENGEPLVVYHGTRDGRFSIFDKSKFGLRTQNENSIAFFFTPSLWYASAYSESGNNERIKQYEEMFGKKPKAIEPRPYAEEKACFLKIVNPKYVKSQTKQEILLAFEENYDGIILKTKDQNNIFEIGVFEPNQIKLADGTNTTFDSKNPDIRFDGGGKVEKLIQLPDVQASEEALARVLKMQGYKLEKETYSKGGRTFNDAELLNKYKKGESIGFTAIAHLKSKGLIERADGTKRKSMEQGGLFKPYKKIEQIAKEKNISLSYAKIKLRKGMKVESEHSNDKKVQEIIALQHLDEDIKYYDKK